MNPENNNQSVRILLLHHSTGQIIWDGGPPTFASRIARKLNAALGRKEACHAIVPLLFAQYNQQNGKAYSIEELSFPKREPYGWQNYPYDYYNIWVKNAGPKAFLEEPTLELLTSKYQVIVFKHCYPVSNIQPDQLAPDIDSSYKSLTNYKLQYLALRNKMRQFPETQFIVWTGAAQVKARISEQEAQLAREFSRWVIHEWDQPDDNIFVWDFYGLQTEGELYLQPKFAQSAVNSHPNKYFSGYAARLLCRRILDVVETNGTGTTISGAAIARSRGASENPWSNLQRHDVHGDTRACKLGG